MLRAAIITYQRLLQRSPLVARTPYRRSVFYSVSHAPPETLYESIATGRG